MSLFPIISPGGPPPTITYIAETSSGSNLTIYTFAAADFGSPTLDEGKLLICCCGQKVATSDPQVSSITESGNSLSQVVAQVAGDTSRLSAIWQLNDRAAGALGEVVITFNGVQHRAGCGLFVATNTADAASDTGVSTAAPLSSALTIPANGVAIGHAQAGADSDTATWAELTEDFDTRVGAETMRQTGASLFSAAGDTPTITCTWSGAGGSPAMTLAAYAGA